MGSTRRRRMSDRGLTSCQWGNLGPRGLFISLLLCAGSVQSGLLPMSCGMYLWWHAICAIVVSFPFHGTCGEPSRRLQQALSNPGFSALGCAASSSRVVGRVLCLTSSQLSFRQPSYRVYLCRDRTSWDRPGPVRGIQDHTRADLF